MDEWHERDDGTWFIIDSDTGEEVDISDVEMDEALRRYGKYRRIEKKYVSARIKDTIHHFRRIGWKAKKAQFGYKFTVIFSIFVIIEDILKKSTVLIILFTSLLMIMNELGTQNNFVTNWAMNEVGKIAIIYLAAGLAIFILNKLMIKWVYSRIGYLHSIWTCVGCEETGILRNPDQYSLCMDCNGTGLIMHIESRGEGMTEELKQEEIDATEFVLN